MFLSNKFINRCGEEHMTVMHECCDHAVFCVYLLSDTVNP